jgi:uncharacterized protein (TIGR00725 family)
MTTASDAISLPRRLVGILGGRSFNIRGEEPLRFAEAVGAALARRGYGIVTGGDDGIGAAACKGCSENGGITIAVLKEAHTGNCSPWITIAIPTSFDLARSVILNWSAQAFVAFEGAYGTMFEIALALDTRRPLVITGEQRLLRLEAVDEPTCRVIRGNDVANAERVVDAIEAFETGETLATGSPGPGPGVLDGRNRRVAS